MFTVVEPLLPTVRLPYTANVPASTIAADVTKPLTAVPKPTVRLVTVKVVLMGICVTCQVPLVVLVNVKAVTVVLLGTTLLMLAEPADVPTAPKIAVSSGPGKPLPGSQLAAVAQLLAPEVATFHKKVVAKLD